MVGPRALCTHVVACPVAASRSFAVCASMRALPPAVSPLGWAPCSVALPSLVGWSPHSRSARDRRLPSEVRACQTVRQSDEYSACSRCYSRHTIGGKQELTKAERTMNQGASTLLSYPMYCAPRHVRVLRSPRTMSSHHIRIPRLRENPRQFHDLVIFTQCRSCAPRGRPLQLRYKQASSHYTMYQRNVPPEPRQLQQLLPSLGRCAHASLHSD